MEPGGKLDVKFRRKGHSGICTMNVETIFAEWTARCRQLARRAREDAQRSAELAHLNPDATLQVVRKEPTLPPRKS